MLSHNKTTLPGTGAFPVLPNLRPEPVPVLGNPDCGKIGAKGTKISWTHSGILRDFPNKKYHNNNDFW